MRSSGTTLPIASATSGNMRFGSVWKGSASSLAMMYWLKLKALSSGGARASLFSSRR